MNAVAKLDVLMAPGLLSSIDLRGYYCAVVDVLRATTTIAVALNNGAAAVYPCLAINEARTKAGQFGRQQSLLGGEERGEFIEGFDLGNSPYEYMDRETIKGKSIFFYTSNGTGAVRKTYDSSGSTVHIASLVNVSSAASELAAKYIAQNTEGIAVVCSGRYGKPSSEDLFCAGLVIDRALTKLHASGITTELSDGAMISREFAMQHEGNSLSVLEACEHGRFLLSLKFSRDLEFAAGLDKIEIVPEFDGDRITIR